MLRHCLVWTRSPVDKPTANPLKNSKGYEPSAVHIDINYLLLLPDEVPRRYIFVTIGPLDRVRDPHRLV